MALQLCNMLFPIYGQFHRRGRYIQTQFSNFNLAQTVQKELSSFPFMNMFVPTDMLTWLGFAN